MLDEIGTIVVTVAIEAGKGIYKFVNNPIKNFCNAKKIKDLEKIKSYIKQSKTATKSKSDQSIIAGLAQEVKKLFKECFINTFKDQQKKLTQNIQGKISKMSSETNQDGLKINKSHVVASLAHEYFCKNDNDDKGNTKKITQNWLENAKIAREEVRQSVRKLVSNNNKDHKFQVASFCTAFLRTTEKLEMHQKEEYFHELITGNCLVGEDLKNVLLNETIKKEIQELKLNRESKKEMDRLDSCKNAVDVKKEIAETIGKNNYGNAADKIREMPAELAYSSLLEQSIDEALKIIEILKKSDRGKQISEYYFAWLFGFIQGTSKAQENGKIKPHENEIKENEENLKLLFNNGKREEFISFAHSLLSKNIIEQQRKKNRENSQRFKNPNIEETLSTNPEIAPEKPLPPPPEMQDFT